MTESTNNHMRKRHLQHADLLVDYVSRSGIEIENAELGLLTSAKYQENMSGAQEQALCVAISSVVNKIAPVTLESLQESSPFLRPAPWQKILGFKNQAQRSLRLYELIALALVMVTIIMQSYYIIGVNVIEKIEHEFEQSNLIREKITLASKMNESTNNDNKALLELKKIEKELDQRFDANYSLLKSWSKCWSNSLFSFGDSNLPTGRLTE
ncbi:MAG: hypothetical protein HRT88_13960, partial [Lentisphaeraceae bacterium]|nr:hypothetical protein [Lentisphaeraceae bacterium]